MSVIPSRSQSRAPSAFGRFFRRLAAALGTAEARAFGVDPTEA